MILNYERLIKHIVNWIRDYAKDNGKKALVVQAMETHDALVTRWLCDKTRIPVITVSHLAFNKELMMRSDDSDGIIIDSLTLDDVWIRAYKKNQVGDILPLGDLHLTEIHALYKHLNLGDEDINFFGIRKWSATDIEWAHRQDVGPGPGPEQGIISGEEDPVRHRNWGGYSAKQREMVAKMHQIEKRTRHKIINNIPKCSVRNIKGLVR